MQQKIGLASILTLIAMLFVLAAWGGSAPAKDASESAIQPAHAIALQRAGDMP
jgi:hypothetical protein